jgi:hypothetical protein
MESIKLYEGNQMGRNGGSPCIDGGFHSTNQESAGTSAGSAPLNPASDSAW